MAEVDRLSTASSLDFLGHPRGLAYLFATEMWERFSYCGMCALFGLAQSTLCEWILGARLTRIFDGPLGLRLTVSGAA